MITESNDRDNVLQTLERLARAVMAYVGGDYPVEHRRELLPAHESAPSLR